MTVFSSVLTDCVIPVYTINHKNMKLLIHGLSCHGQWRIAAASTIIETKKRQVRCTWVRPWLRGTWSTKNYAGKKKRMRTEAYDELLSLVENVTKQDTVMWEAVTAKVKLAATIRYLTTGVEYQEKIGKICNIIMREIDNFWVGSLDEYLVLNISLISCHE